MKAETTAIRAVLFDFDGTLIGPGTIDCAKIKASIDCPEAVPVLEFIEGLPDAGARDRALKALERYEAEAAVDARPNPRAEETLRFLRDRGLRVGIISRNRRRFIERALENFTSTRPSDFDLIIARDMPDAPRSSPDSIRLAAERLRLTTARS